MTPTTRPGTSNRDSLLRSLIDRGISNDSLGEIVYSMRGKSQEEKERIAAEILKNLTTSK